MVESFFYWRDEFFSPYKPLSPFWVPVDRSTFVDTLSDIEARIFLNKVCFYKAATPTEWKVFQQLF